TQFRILLFQRSNSRVHADAKPATERRSAPRPISFDAVNNHDVFRPSVSPSTNEPTWIDDHPTSTSLFGLLALIVFVLCMTIGFPISRFFSP
ncbi:MAG TPA: hypothetical protein VG125_17020, partial [Pirellulales bacterium]|nr:hypothetical protein [Pirellulales bacterium]